MDHYVKPLFIGILLQFSASTSKAQDVTISPEGPVVVPEGDILDVTCTDRTSVGLGNQIVIDRNGILDTSIPRSVNGSVVIYFIGPVALSDNGTVYRCAHGVLSTPPSSNIILLVRYVPNAPQRLTAFNILPFSAKLSWEPPSDNESSPEPLTYTVTLTNITDGAVSQYNVTTTQITLTNLLPGVQYNVSVYAGYSLASGPPVVVTFRTNSSVPIIKRVSVQINNEQNLILYVALVTNGGKPTSNYYVTFNGRATAYPSISQANQSGMSFELNGSMLSSGQGSSLSVLVENELGNSTQVNTLVVVLSTSSEVAVNGTVEVPTSTTTGESRDIAVPILSAVVGVLAVIILTMTFIALAVGVCAYMKRKNKENKEIHSPAPYESPVELKDVHKKNSEEQERSVDPSLLPNPAYEPLEVCEPEYL